MISPYTAPGIIDKNTPMIFIQSLPLDNEHAVLEYCAAVYKVNAQDIKSDSKKGNLPLARQLASYIFIKKLKYKYQYTATILYPKSENHANVLYGVKKFAQDWEVDKFLRRKLILAVTFNIK